MFNLVTSPHASREIVTAIFCGLALTPSISDLRADDHNAAPATASAALVPAAPQVVLLWSGGAGNLQGADEKEITDPADPQPGQRIKSIKNVHNPSIEVHFPPADKAVGTAIIVAPGGGHRQLVWGSEGTDIAAWLNDLGVTAVVLKYRLAQTPGYKYAVSNRRHATRCSYRAGGSANGKSTPHGGPFGLFRCAGGALAAYADIRFDRGDANATDPINQQSCRPDFVGLVYPGWSQMDTEVPKDAAPAFLTSAGLDDKFHARQTVEFHNMLFRAGVPSDLHIYAHGGHGGAISKRNGIPFGTWHIRFQDWLADLGLLKAAAAQ